ncbi:trypsin-like serine peptidase [Calothrix sp. NIES-2098]|uniref:trypsin-like serine peptidase n=1 Tax=Calothrix sp. NIES-2098 TaxID=1954171 RepID=UPI000B5EFAD8|nr:hypothetical protein NIES2098_57510 [Calothrix sp. NIES-2098]
MSITITPSRQILLDTWFLPGSLGERLNLSSIPFPSKQDDVLEDIEDSDLVDIINSRFDINPSSRISAVFGQPDFLPFSFLELGVRRGAAVCRLVREFSEPARVELLDKIDALENELKKRGQGVLSEEDIKEIFSLAEKEPDCIQQLFDGIDINHPSDALKDPERFKKLLPVPIATGFLVGSSYLLTNHHVLPDKEVCAQVIAQFGYDQDGLGRKIPPVEYKLDPNSVTGFFETNEELDYTLVKLQDRPKDPNLSILGRAGDRFGWIPLDENSTNIAPPIDDEKLRKLQKIGVQQNISQEKLIEGEPVNIIQHPKGKRKQVILSSNKVTNIYKKFIRYEADADFSSSGSPVFNQQWQLVALHNSAVANIKADSTIEIVAEQGVRICEIVKDLQEKSLSSEKIKNFIDLFVDTKEKEAENKPTQSLPASAY